MARFKYSAISKSGATVNGILEAYDEMDAVAKIKVNCSIVNSVELITTGKKSVLDIELDAGSMNVKAFTLMCSQFSIILRSGIPLARTVELINERMKDKKLKKMLTSVSEDVQGGRSLSASFEAHGKKFLPVTFIETVRAGEESGNLSDAFETVYKHFEKEAKTKSGVKSALIYPLFVLVIAIAVVIVLMVKVVPTFTSIFAEQGSDIPGITKLLINISTFFQNSWWIILIVVAVLVIAYLIFGSTMNGKLKIAKAKLKLPVLGNIHLMQAASEFANNMATLVGSGLPITRAVRITSRVISNYYIGKQIEQMIGKIEEGRTLGVALKEANVLPDILVDMTSVGEETGELEDTLKTISGYYDAELEAATKSALSKLEPAILVGVAAIAGFIVIAIYVAMFEMYNVM